MSVKCDYFGQMGICWMTSMHFPMRKFSVILWQLDLRMTIHYSERLPRNKLRKRTLVSISTKVSGNSFTGE